MNNLSDVVSKSWFCVYNNPAERDARFAEKEPVQILEIMRADWLALSPDCTGAWAYCISADGLHHVHMVLERGTAMRFSWIKSRYCVGMHIEPTRGNKEQAEDYINKNGKFAEKGETVVCTLYAGEIKGKQGHRSDLDDIASLIDDGCTPRDIMMSNFAYRRYERMIKTAYYDKRYADTPIMRDVAVHWLFGNTGTGKSYTYVQLCEEHGEENVYRVTDYEHPWDKYNGEPVLFLDEFRGGIAYGQLLLVLDKYKSTLPARYSNINSLWHTVYIASPMLPQEVYNNLANNDGIQQLYRRITDITYFDKFNGLYGTYTLDGGYHIREEFVGKCYFSTNTTTTTNNNAESIMAKAAENGIPVEITQKSATDTAISVTAIEN